MPGIPSPPLLGLKALVLGIANARVLREGQGDARYRPSPLLVKNVEAGWLGRKIGRGFCQSDSPGRGAP